MDSTLNPLGPAGWRREAMRDNAYKNPFVSGIHNPGVVGDYPRTLTELAMGQCSAEFRRRSDWWQAVQNPDTAREWALAAENRTWTVSSAGQPSVEIKLSPKQVQYLIDELAGYAKLRDQENRCEVSCFERIWESTRLPLGTELDAAISALSPNKESKNNNGTVSLIDPYLCPLVYNHSQIRNGPFKIRPARAPMVFDLNSQYALSVAGATLPSLVSISKTGQAKFDSYINNLDPELDSKTYDVLSKGLTAMIPMFEHVLTDLHTDNPLPQRINGGCKYVTLDEPQEPNDPENEEAWAQYERDIREWLTSRPIQEPDIPKSGYLGGLEYRRRLVDLKGCKVKVLVEVEEINLQPGGTDIPATQWHVEGMLNENIVANGLYITAMENIAPTSLEFRMATCQPRGFMPGDTGAVLRPWGLAEGAPSNQVVGSRPIEPNLAITFPNIYQHRQTDISLLDRTQPGRLQVVKFCLVDPMAEEDVVVTTAQVAPQQAATVKRALDRSLDKRIPLEIVDEIVKNIDGVMSPNDAKKWGRLIRLEREAFREDNDRYHFCVPFDIWSVGQGLLTGI